MQTDQVRFTNGYIMLVQQFQRTYVDEWVWNMERLQRASAVLKGEFRHDTGDYTNVLSYSAKETDVIDAGNMFWKRIR